MVSHDWNTGADFFRRGHRLRASSAAGAGMFKAPFSALAPVDNIYIIIIQAGRQAPIGDIRIIALA